MTSETCAIAGHFPELPPIPASRSCAPADRDPRDVTRQRPVTPPDLLGPKQSWRRAPNAVPVDIYLAYRAPWRSPEAGEPEVNVWGLDEDAGGLVVLAVARVTDVAAMVPLAVPVSRARRAGRRMLFAIEDGESFAIEPALYEGLPRVRLILRRAPVEIAQRLRSME